MGKRRGVNYAEFSAEINIPRMTLQGYLNGTSYLRTDSMENLVDKLGISVAEFVSGEEHFASVSNPDFDQILSNILTLPPRFCLPLSKQLLCWKACSNCLGNCMKQRA